MLTLDVVVERAVLLLVLPHQAEGVVVPKVLKLDQCVLAVFIHHSLHELIQQVLVGLRAVSLLVQAHVEGVPQQALKEKGLDAIRYGLLIRSVLCRIATGHRQM